MKKIILAANIATISLLSAHASEGVSINLGMPQNPVSESMYGIFFEEINHAGDGGLYAELVQNRSFEELEMPKGYHCDGDRLHPNPVKNHITGNIEKQTFRWTKDPVPAWTLEAESGCASMKLTKENPKFQTAPNNLEVSISDASTPVRLVNSGYWGMNIERGENYLFRAIVKTSEDYKGSIVLKLLSDDGKVLAKKPVNLKNPIQWNDVKFTLSPDGSDSEAKLAIEFDSVGKVWLDYVSLFPQKTFKNRPNGLRKDVAEALQGLKPAFVRWPGGCVVEGISLENRFEWKKTLGDPAARPGEYSTWGYRCSYGFGYHEMLQFCEDINADAMFVCNVGMGCQFRMGDISKNEEIEFYLQECLDAIEYALGDAKTSKWGKIRAKEGHPAPFPLKYVEIGNENRGPEYDKRFDIFYKAIKKKYPSLILISNHGIGGIGKSEKTDMIDPHFYVDPTFFFSNTTIFDNQKRGEYTVYVGEYACNANVGGGNMTAALSEAAFISGMERNGDFVKMASYAPLLENKNDRAWATNLIWLDTDQVVGRSSYYVQKMAAENRPTYNLKTNITHTAPKEISLEKGTIGFGSWETQTEYKDIKITSNGKEIPANLKESSDTRGQWSIEDGILTQKSGDSATKYTLKGISLNDYTLQLKARKTGGKEGFMIYYGLSDNAQTGYLFNIGGWFNSRTAVEIVKGGRNAGMVGDSVSQSIEKDKWYDIKIVASPSKIELFIDGKLTLTHTPSSHPMQFISAGYDEKSGEIIVKIVNADEKPYKTDIKIDGAKKIAPSGKIISLSAKSGSDENSFEEPLKISPIESKYNNFGKSFNYEFPPFSYTIFRIKASKQQ